jgi:2-C-methyl-D-erythritol 2,4-cyclodiphosphate synthase
MVHVGIGYDAHQLAAGRRLVLGGVEISHIKGLGELGGLNNDN